MRAFSNRLAKTSGLVALAAMVLSGCAVTTSSRSLGAVATPLDTVVCSGGHASRFPERQAEGRYCRPSLSLNDIY